jgi:3-methyladenine DNA glycosylase AlkC
MARVSGWKWRSGIKPYYLTRFIHHIQAMPEAFKNLFNKTLIGDSASHLRRVWPAFDHKQFVHLASSGLDGLEMKARAMQIASALQATLPADFDRAAGILESALAPAFEGEDLAPMHTTTSGLAGWVIWSAGEFVVRQGMHMPERALTSLREMTQRFSTEYSIRPFIAEHPALCMKTLKRWARDPNLHVRRLVSEGSRPRLPWGLQLKALVANPSPTLPLLLALQDDSSDYVRRSVANHLNDIAKDHPGLVADWLDQHLPGAPATRIALLRHASRTLVKDGHPRVLQAWGVGAAFSGTATLTLDRKRVQVGGDIGLQVQLHSTAKTSQKLVIDYAVHHVKAHGGTSAKVFKGWKLNLDAGQKLTLDKRHSLKEITTRRYHAGTHRVELLVNGKAAAGAEFQLLAKKI